LIVCPDEEERGGFTSLKSLLGKVPNKLKTALKTNPSQAKATVRASKDSWAQ
jgi:hypothetical protein